MTVLTILRRYRYVGQRRHKFGDIYRWLTPNPNDNEAPGIRIRTGRAVYALPYGDPQAPLPYAFTEVRDIVA